MYYGGGELWRKVVLKTDPKKLNAIRLFLFPSILAILFLVEITGHSCRK